MASDDTIAPKERVKITYQPDTAGAVEERELPMRLLVLGDYSGKADDTPVEERAPVQIDKDNFEDVMSSMNLKLDLRVKNELATVSDDDLDVRLHFDSMADFSPDSIVQQMPEIRQLIDVREALVALKGPLTNDARFRKALQRMLEDEDQRQNIIDELLGESDDE